MFASYVGDSDEMKKTYTLVEIGVGLVLYSLIKSIGKAKKPTPKNKVMKNQPKKAKKAMTYKGKDTGIVQLKLLTTHCNKKTKKRERKKKRKKEGKKIKEKRRIKVE